MWITATTKTLSSIILKKMPNGKRLMNRRRRELWHSRYSLGLVTNFSKALIGSVDLCSAFLQQSVCDLDKAERLRFSGPK